MAKTKSFISVDLEQLVEDIQNALREKGYECEWSGDRGGEWVDGHQDGEQEDFDLVLTIPIEVEIEEDEEED